MTHLSFEPGGQSASVRASKADPGVVAGQVQALADVLVEHSQVHESEQNTDNHQSFAFIYTCLTIVGQPTLTLGESSGCPGSPLSGRQG